MSENTKEIIIILPGFEYKKNGPLSIDKVEITATINNELLDIWYLDTTNKEYNCNKTLSLFRAEQTHYVLGGIYPESSYLYNESVANSKLRRVCNGYYHLKESSNSCILSVFAEEVELKNQDIANHDGLGFIKINNINTDIYYKVNFYSKVKYDSTQTNYVLIDTIIYYYNPLLTGVTGDYNITLTELSNMYYNGRMDDKPIQYTLKDNVIVFKLVGNKKIWVQKDETVYKETSIEINPEELLMFTSPYILLNKPNDADGIYEHDDLTNYNYYNVNLPLIVSACDIVKINPCIVYGDRTSSNTADILLYQRDYYKKKLNVLNIKAEELHKYGIYLCDLGALKGPFTDALNAVNVYKHGPGQIQDIGEPLFYYEKNCGLYLLLSGLSNKKDDWKKRDVLKAKEYINHNKVTKDDYIKHIVDAIARNEDGVLLADTYDDEYKDTSPSLPPDVYNTTYEYSNIPADFKYLYKNPLTVKLYNISPIDPIKTEIDVISSTDPILKKTNASTDTTFIKVGLFKELELGGESNKKLVWNWRDQHQEAGEYVFPNYWLAVQYENNFLQKSNKSDYQIYRQISFLDSNNGIYYGFYDNELVLSTIEIDNYIKIDVNTNSKINEGFCPEYYIEDVTKSFSINIEYDTFYVLNFNGCARHYIYPTNIQDLLVTVLFLNSNNKVLYEKKCRVDEDNTTLFFIKKGEYFIKVVPYKPNTETKQSRTPISSIGLYKVNSDGQGIHQLLLAAYLNSLKESEQTNPIQEYAWNDTIVLPAAFVYQEDSIMCGNMTGRNAIFTPREAYYKVNGTYNINKLTGAISIASTRPKSYYPLNFKLVTLTGDLSKAIQNKKVRV